MDNILKVAGLQIDLHWESPQRNIENIFEQLTKLKEVDLIILPETFSTGFSMKADHLAYNFKSDHLTQLQDWSNRTDTALCGSVWFTEKGTIRNRVLWISPNNEIQHYDKRHLFSLSDEPAIMKAGKERVLIDYKGWKIAPLICYDLRFPVWSKNTADFNYDLLIYVANWPERRSYAWEHLLIARAIENQAYVAGINRVGIDGNGVNHIGASSIISPKGAQIIRAKDNESQSIQASLSKNELINYREKLPFLRDSDNFELVR